MAAAAAGHRAVALLAVAALLLLAGTALADAGGHRQQQGLSNRMPLPIRPVCVKVHGVVAGDTCASVARDWKLDARSFANLNPNVNCTALFPGQWLCVDGAMIG